VTKLPPKVLVEVLMRDAVNLKIVRLVDLLIEELDRRVKNGQHPTSKNERPLKKGLLTLQEAAGYLSMTPNALYMATARRQFPFVKMGRRVRFREEDLKAYIAANLVQAEPQISHDGRRRRGC
jgi:excisionase family DNA binding protein